MAGPASTSGGAAAADASPDVPRKVEEALLFQLKQRAYAACTSVAAAYADCCRGRTVTMVVACRDELKALSACLGQHTNEACLAELKRRWVGAGQPDKPDWDRLLDGL